MRIHTTLTNARETFVRNLLMANIAMTFAEVNKTLASEDHKDLWATRPDSSQKPLMMAFKRIQELREAAKIANDHVANGQPVPPIPPSSLKKVKAVKAEIVADAPADDTIVVTVDNIDGKDVVEPVSPGISNDTASEATEAACQAV